MALPLFFIMNAGRIIPIVVGIGTALARFVAKNPKIIGTTISIDAISSAIQSYVTTEKEKIAIVDEIGKENPQLKYDIFKNMFFSNTNIVSKIAPYLVVALIIYYFLRKWKYPPAVIQGAQRYPICSCSCLVWLISLLDCASQMTCLPVRYFY